MDAFAPPNICRDVLTKTESYKQSLDPRKALQQHISQPPRLKSRKSFVRAYALKSINTETGQLKQWNEIDLFSILPSLALQNPSKLDNC